LKAYALTPSAGQQLDFSRVASGLTTSCIGLEELPVLLAELNADIGKDRVGTLSLVDSLRPEHQCKLVPALCKSAKRGRALRRKNSKSSVAEFAAEASDRTSAWPNAPTRLLTKPLPIDAVIRIGGTLALERRLYTIESIHFEQRLDNVEWWTHSAVSRDYLRLWLAREQGGLQALVYVDRSNGARFLQAIAD
jgi:hypothetical protein